MQGKSHLLVGLTAAVVFDSVLHVTGDPLTMAKIVPLTLLVKKASIILPSALAHCCRISITHAVHLVTNWAG